MKFSEDELVGVYDFGVDGCRLTKAVIERVISFHGHYCVGLSIGIRVGDWVLREFGYSEDEELVAVVETDMCAVDAIQFLVGCTFGKGNFIFLDYGKNAYSFFRRSDGKNVRITPRIEKNKNGIIVANSFLSDLREQQKQLDPNDIDGQKRIRESMIDRVMRTNFDNMFSITPARIPMPDKARIYQSFPCDKCGELVMSTRLTINKNEKNICKECLKMDSDY
ncbi:MAG: FmdE family protein [Planctomycetaceae bacterium]|jgi:formylmethanofuran dehydrogenase subunit E|nr:FmdE family protein [Planctomycetaceae bacterium]